VLLASPGAWRLVPGQALLHHGAGDEHLVFNDLSGDTHLLDAQAMQVLHALQAGPLTPAQLQGSCSDADEPEAITALLAELQDLKLVQPA
jgi:PqqD family protein of HPr-rel-A system